MQGRHARVADVQVPHIEQSAALPLAFHHVFTRPFLAFNANVRPAEPMWLEADRTTALVI